MFDLHYDLLTNILIRQDDINGLKKEFYDTYREDNIIGGIFNLFYMSPKEMKDELGFKLEDIDIVKNLQTVNQLIKKNQLIPSGIEYIYGIEGLDYLKSIEDIDKIYELGVRSVNVVWNNENKFGGGAKGNKECGLTSLGKELIEKLVKRKIAIDLSHSNEKTFYDILNECKKYVKYDPMVFASHSNCRKLCNTSRNLTDNQILKIKEMNGVIGIVGIKEFCLENKRCSEIEYNNSYIEHIKYLKEVLGDNDNISIATDDLEYYKINPKYYKNANIFKQKHIKKSIEKLLLKSNYDKSEIKKILTSNFKDKILQRL